MNKEWYLKVLEAIGKYIQLIVDVLAIMFKRPPSWSLISYQIYSIGVMSLPVVAITGFSTGLILTAQSFFQLSDKGLAGATGVMVAKAMTTELGPVLTAFMITGRVGAAMCAELGTMRVTEQIDAMHSMAVNPYRYLICPRFIAGTLMLPLLTLFSCITGIIGGYLLSVYYFDMSPINFLDPIQLHVTGFDLYSGLAKSVVFGMLISTISCYKGLTTAGGAEGVGKATTQSVVICYALILITNFFLTIFINGLYSYLWW